jgi:hypothetical protein
MRSILFILIIFSSINVVAQDVSSMIDKAIKSKEEIALVNEHRIQTYFKSDSLRISYNESGDYSYGIIKSNNGNYFLFIEDKKSEILILFDSYDFENSINHALPTNLYKQMTITVIKKDFMPVMLFYSVNGLIDGFYYLFSNNNDEFTVCGDIFNSDNIFKFNMEEINFFYSKLKEIDNSDCQNQKMKYIEELRSAILN